jgi:predicted O-methyltransferase YrrM
MTERTTKEELSDLFERIRYAHREPVIRKGRNVAAGNLRGWGLEFTDLLQHIATLPDYASALSLASGRSLVTAPKLANLYLLMKFGLNVIPGDIIEFGSFRGGSALFMAKLLRQWGSKKKVYALDTYEGMPPTDIEIDMHRAGDFADATVEEIEQIRDKHGLNDRLVLKKGLFEHTLPHLLNEGMFSLVHVDCDIYHSIEFVLRAIDGHLSPGSYVVFDDPLFGSCLGAMEACEEVYIQGKGLHAEQAFPHLVYRPNGALTVANKVSSVSA